MMKLRQKKTAFKTYRVEGTPVRILTHLRDCAIIRQIKVGTDQPIRMGHGLELSQSIGMPLTADSSPHDFGRLDSNLDIWAVRSTGTGANVTVMITYLEWVEEDEE